MMKFGIYYYPKKEEAKKFAKKTEKWLKKKNFNTKVNKLDRNIKIGIVFGGDGTILYVSNRIAKRKLDIPIIRVNFGEVGYLTNVSPENIHSYLSKIIHKKAYRIIKRSRVKATLYRNNKKIFSSSGLNEIVIERTSTKPIKVGIKSEIEKINEIKLGCDGIIFSTKTGSTAYNASAGGKIPKDENSLAITIVCKTNRNIFLPPIVSFDNETMIRTTILPENLPRNGRLVVDGRAVKLKQNDEIVISKSKTKTLFIEF